MSNGLALSKNMRLIEVEPSCSCYGALLWSYTTNISLADFVRLLCSYCIGEPLPAGGPMRLVVPTSTLGRALSGLMVWSFTEQTWFLGAMATTDRTVGGRAI